jgi:hypothetical protein
VGIEVSARTVARLLKKHRASESGSYVTVRPPDGATPTSGSARRCGIGVRVSPDTLCVGYRGLAAATKGGASAAPRRLGTDLSM